MSPSWERSPVAHAPISVIVLTDQTDPAQLQARLHELAPVLQERQQPFEILIPATTGVASAWQPVIAASPGVRLIVDDGVSQGVGVALRMGIAAASHPLVFVLPDGYSAKTLPALLKEIDQVDLVCGARESRARGWKRRQFFSRAYQLFGIWMQDPDCMLGLYRRELFDRLPLQSKGAFVQTELIAKANFQGKILTDVAVSGPDHEPGKNTSDFWRVLNSPDFGPPPERVAEVAAKPLIQTQAPEVRS